MNFFKKITKKRVGVLVLSALFVTNTFLSVSMNVSAENNPSEEAEARKSLPIASNSYENWPNGPALGAQSAILVEANTGTILYAKNVNDRLFPASVTKILTALLAVENSKMEEIVNYSHEAVFSIEPGSSNIGMDVGEKITMEQSLYGLLVNSGNECANAIGEHIAGSINDFVDMMNKKAKELGCLDTNFVNTNGLPADNHYTSAYDLSLIAREFFKNELLCKMSNTESYYIPQCATQPDDDLYIHSKNKLLKGRSYEYDYLVGSKTGYTNTSRQTLVSCAQKDGLKLICVILKEESPSQYTDTIDLFNYGFQNFTKVNISENEVTYSFESTDFFNANQDVLGDSAPTLSLDQDAYIILPNTASFDKTESTLSYDQKKSNIIATIDYTYNGIPVGSVTVSVKSNAKKKSELTPAGFDNSGGGNASEKREENVLFINVTRVFLIIILISGILITIFVTKSLINNYQFSKKRNAHKKRKKNFTSKYDKYDFK